MGSEMCIRDRCLMFNFFSFYDTLQVLHDIIHISAVIVSFVPNHSIEYNLNNQVMKFQMTGGILILVLLARMVSVC